MVAHWLAELDGRRVSVEVPASAANLGAGYDCLGLALALTNKVEVEVRSLEVYDRLLDEAPGACQAVPG